MNVLALLVTLLVLNGSASAPAALPSAKQVLAKSLAYHDPQKAWSSRPIEMTIEVRLAERLATARGYASRTDRILVDNSTGRFRYRSERGENRIEVACEGDVFSAHLNGSSEISADDREKHRLTPDRLPGWRDYFVYMFGLPMKLTDPGTLLDPKVERTEFNEQEVLVLRVTYEPEVGGDTWYFYLDPQTYGLTGCRFYHDESKNDGEYLVYEQEVEGPHGLRLPKLRHWYVNKDAEYIAVDEVASIRDASGE